MKMSHGYLTNTTMLTSSSNDNMRSAIKADIHHTSGSESSSGLPYYDSNKTTTDDTASSYSYPFGSRKMSDSSEYSPRIKSRIDGGYFGWKDRGYGSDKIDKYPETNRIDPDISDCGSVRSLPVKNLKISDSNTKYSMPHNVNNNKSDYSDNYENFGLPLHSNFRAFSDTSSSCSLPPYNEIPNVINDTFYVKNHHSKDVISCRICGQFHKAGETHLYDYYQPVDDDILCKICGQPLVGPVDTRCGHTYCARCLQTYLRINSTCKVCNTAIIYKMCQQSSIIVRRLLDKLLVVCPNVDYCEEVLQRCDLDSHLRHNCRGAVTKCPHSSEGCTFRGPRSALSSHLWECVFKTPQKGRKPVVDGHITRINIEQGDRDLGLSIVGGADTPLTCVVIQEVLIGGAVADDGRLLQGDLILEINGDDLTQATHHKAIQFLQQRRHMCRLTVYREKIAEQFPNRTDETFKVVFSKEKNPQLGIKLVSRRSGQGVYILGLVPGGQASIDGQLQADDRVTEINGHSLIHGTQEQAAFLIQKSPDLVEVIVSRLNRPETPDLIRCISQYSNYNEILDIKPEFSRLLKSGKCQEKFITVKKDSKEPLGLSIAGGTGGQRGDTPIYISNINPGGCFGRDRQLAKGDILLSVNGTSLYGLSHTDAVTVLKAQNNERSVSLRIVTSPEIYNENDDITNFTPSWFYWLQLPEVYQALNVVTLQRSPCGSLGFSIVGGTDSCHGSIPIYIKSVVQDTPASRDGRLRCGDMILSVNKHSLRSISHDQAVSILKLAQTNVTITVVSWPGSVV